MVKPVGSTIASTQTYVVKPQGFKRIGIKTITSVQKDRTSHEGSNLIEFQGGKLGPLRGYDDGISLRGGIVR